MKTNEVRYAYDDQGKMVKKINQQDYTREWQYDDQNKITSEKGYSYGKLAYTKDYHYFDGGYRYSTIYTDDDMNTLSPVFTIHLDSQNRTIREAITHNGLSCSSKNTVYDKKGRIIKTVSLDDKGHPEITHIYVYN